MVTLSRDGGEEIDARCSRARQLRLRRKLLYSLCSLYFFINVNSLSYLKFRKFKLENAIFVLT